MRNYLPIIKSLPGQSITDEVYRVSRWSSTIKNKAFFGNKHIKKVILPFSLKKIGDEAFSCCRNLREIELGEKLKRIGGQAFYDCRELESVSIPSSVEEIGEYAFANCKSLKNVVFPKNTSKMNRGVFKGCTSLESVTIPNGVEEILSSAFCECESLKTIQLPNSVKNICFYAFSDCKSLTKVEIPAGVDIEMNAFEGCNAIEELVFNGPAEVIYQNNFIGFNFNYAYKMKGSGKIVFAKNLPENESEIESLIDINMANSCIEGFDIGQLAVADNFDKYKIMIEKFVKAKVSFPVSFAQGLVKANKHNEIGNDLVFKFFNNEVLKELSKLKLTEEGRNTIYKLAFALGCFSTEKMLDKNGNPTNVMKGQKASTFLALILRNRLLINDYDMKEYEFVEDFACLSYGEKFSQEFLNFISAKPDGKNYSNWQILTSLEQEYNGMILSVARNFKSVESLRVVLDETGCPKKLSWTDALVRFYNRKNYRNITEETEEIANIYADKEVSETTFEQALKFYKKARQKGVKPHILKTHLKEETILEAIEKIKKSVDITLAENKELIEELYDKKFTFEFLSKDDPRNAIIGIYCSCCATLSSVHYGKEIAKATILAKDVQNLVIRDAKGEIVAKGAIYVSPKGYAVFNDIEVNEKYRKYECDEEDTLTDIEIKEEQDRELIFSAFMRGVKAFVEEYDKEHPNKPIKKINIGMRFNRLQRQCMRYEEETEFLTVPKEYGFHDALVEQRILYERGRNTEITEEQGR